MKDYKDASKSYLYEIIMVMLDEGYTISDLLYVLSDAIKDCIENEET